MKLASVEIIKNVINHPNADSLDIVTILGYKAIVKRGLYKENDLIVFIQPDTILPDSNWATFYKSKSSRVKAIRLRNCWSMGIVESTNILPPETQIVEGMDVTNILGIVKYEAPVPQQLDAKGPLPMGIGETDEERYQNIIDIPYGDTVDVTLKVDGTSMTIYCKKNDDEYVCGITSRTLELKSDCENKYTITAKNLGLFDKILNYCKNNNVNLAFRGELYGQGIQKMKHNPHCNKPFGFAMFSVYNIDTHSYEGIDSVHYYNKVAKQLGIETVTMLEENVVLTPELIKKYDEELENINGVPFEGVVIKTKTGGSFKIINKSYDSKK